MDLRINYLRWAIAAAVFVAAYLVFSDSELLLLVLAAAASYFVSGFLYRWVKKTFYRPILLFDLHGVIIAGDFQVENIYERPGTRDLIRRLRSRYFVAALTNFSPELIKFYDKKFGLMGEFDAFYYSGKYGIRKPDARIFQIVLRSLGVRPADVIFLDDVADNVAAAKKLGMNGIVFENASQAEKALNSMGIRTR